MKMSYGEMVREFHDKMGVEMPSKYTKMPFEQFVTRHNMLKEEYQEYVNSGTVVDIVDAYADMMYVMIGTMLIMGIDPDAIFEEVHKSNMTKDGANRNAEGKILKDERFIAPNLRTVIGVDD
jgi:predicted HAD superfamily Cof-like phosphohydrolase